MQFLSRIVSAYVSQNPLGAWWQQLCALALPRQSDDNTAEKELRAGVQRSSCSSGGDALARGAAGWLLKVRELARGWRYHFGFFFFFNLRVDMVAVFAGLNRAGETAEPFVWE